MEPFNPFQPGKPSCGIPPEERAAFFTKVSDLFLEFAAKEFRDVSRNDRQAVDYKLVREHHWLPSQASQVTVSELPLCLPDDWREFLKTQTETVRVMLAAWPEEHPFPIQTSSGD
jgi:hypothetical protein